MDEERRISVEVVRHLMEIKRRRLYAERGFESMWECLIEEFKLSKGAAQNRLNVIRVLEEHPELASHLESGNLCFTVVSELARVCRELEKEPSELLPLILGKSSREATRALLDLLPAGKHREGFRDLPGGLSELRLILTADQREIFEELRAIKSHTSRTYSSMLVKLADDDLQKHDPVRRSKVQAPGVTNPYSTHVPRALRDQVWVRDGGRCTTKIPSPAASVARRTTRRSTTSIPAPSAARTSSAT